MVPQRHLIHRGRPHVPRRGHRRTPVRRHPLARRPGVPPVPLRQRAVRLRPPLHALPLPRLPQALLRAHRLAHGRHQARLPHLGAGHLPAIHRPQGHLQHEAEPQAGHHAEVGLAPRPSPALRLRAPRGLVRGPGGGRRGLHRGPGAQQARQQEAQRRARDGWQAAGGRGAGPCQRPRGRQGRSRARASRSCRAS